MHETLTSKGAEAEKKNYQSDAPKKAEVPIKKSRKDRRMAAKRARTRNCDMRKELEGR